MAVGQLTCDNGCGMLPDCASFQLALLDRFGSKLRAKQALANIVNLAQGTKSVRQYVAEFEFNTRRLESSDEATLMQFRIWGLLIDIAEWVSITHPTSLSQAIAMAEEIELGVKFAMRPPVRTPAHSQSSGHSRRGQLVVLVWGVPCGETQKDAGGEEVDVVVNPRAGTRWS